jgi:hypothetical protein
VQAESTAKEPGNYPLVAAADWLRLADRRASTPRHSPAGWDAHDEYSQNLIEEKGMLDERDIPRFRVGQRVRPSQYGKDRHIFPKARWDQTGVVDEGRTIQRAYGSLGGPEDAKILLPWLHRARP